MCSWLFGNAAAGFFGSMNELFHGFDFDARLGLVTPGASLPEEAKETMLSSSGSENH